MIEFFLKKCVDKALTLYYDKAQEAGSFEIYFKPVMKSSSYYS